MICSRSRCAEDLLLSVYDEYDDYCSEHNLDRVFGVFGSQCSVEIPSKSGAHCFDMFLPFQVVFFPFRSFLLLFPWPLEVQLMISITVLHGNGVNGSDHVQSDCLWSCTNDLHTHTYIYIYIYMQYVFKIIGAYIHSVGWKHVEILRKYQAVRQSSASCVFFPPWVLYIVRTQKHQPFR